MILCQFSVLLFGSISAWPGALSIIVSLTGFVTVLVLLVLRHSSHVSLSYQFMVSIWLGHMKLYQFMFSKELLPFQAKFLKKKSHRH